MEGLTEGRVVHFVLPDGPHKGDHRPAIIVKVWRQGDGTPPANGYSNLVVFMDGTNDGGQFGGCIRWETSVTHSDAPEPRTWHWIEKA
jgi:predicted RNA-binding protein with TRAM domain